jgi:MoaA/NifB/PqqE/SkfB family radical SAM enzyme
MKYLEKIKKIQFELSNFCNASCIGCRRSDPVTLTPRYDLANLDSTFVSLEVIQSLINDPLFDDVYELEFCGTIDEPLAHPKFIEILNLFSAKRTNLFIRIHTNAAVRNEFFYIELVEALSKFEKHEVRFSIDGLEESHRLYRGDLDYKKIMEHAQQFINYGGDAVWQMLQFPWNEHEIDECTRIAKEMGFRKIVVRRDRTHSSEFSTIEIKSLRDKKTPSNFREAPVDFKLPEEKDEVISCHYSKEGMIFMNYQGRIFPCCFLSNLELINFTSRAQQFFDKIYATHGADFNDLHVRSLTEIMNNRWYQQDLTASWQNEFSDKVNPKLIVCSQSCGKKSVPKANHILQEEFDV